MTDDDLFPESDDSRDPDCLPDENPLETGCIPLHLLRLAMFQPTMHPKRLHHERFDNAYGRVEVIEATLGQREADVMDALIAKAIEVRYDKSGRACALVDPYTIRKTLSEKGYSGERLTSTLNRLMTGLFRLETETRQGRVSVTAHLIDRVVRRKSDQINSLNGQPRDLMVVVLGLEWTQVAMADMGVRLPVEKIAQLKNGLLKAVIRLFLTHREGTRHSAEKVLGQLQVTQPAARRKARHILQRNKAVLGEFGLILEDGFIEKANLPGVQNRTDLNSGVPQRPTKLPKSNSKRSTAANERSTAANGVPQRPTSVPQRPTKSTLSRSFRSYSRSSRKEKDSSSISSNLGGHEAAGKTDDRTAVSGCPTPSPASDAPPSRTRPHKGRSDTEEQFGLFYAAYPRHQGRRKALASWMKLCPDDALFQVILAAVEAHKQTEQWRKDDGRFIPLPATWLNQARWEDEVEPAPLPRNDHEEPDYDSPAFARLWAAYPRHDNKYAAWQACRHLDPDHGLIERMVQAIKRSARSAQWQRESGKYIPSLASWLSGRRWEDDAAGRGPSDGVATVSLAEFERREREAAEQDRETIQRLRRRFAEAENGGAAASATLP